MTRPRADLPPLKKIVSYEYDSYGSPLEVLECGHKYYSRSFSGVSGAGARRRCPKCYKASHGQ